MLVCINQSINSSLVLELKGDDSLHLLPVGVPYGAGYGTVVVFPHSVYPVALLLLLPPCWLVIFSVNSLLSLLYCPSYVLHSFHAGQYTLCFPFYNLNI